MLPSVKLSVNGISRGILRELRRNITRTSSLPSSDAISTQNDNKLKVNQQLERTSRSYMGWVNLSNNIRSLSTIQAKVKPPGNMEPLIAISKQESREFVEVFPEIIRDLTVGVGDTRLPHLPEVTERFAKVLKFNVGTGKKTRGLATVAAYKILEKPENLPPENIKLANILGWCAEMLQSYFIVTDDIVDNSETRRGAPCWYELEDVGLQAVNDGLFIENSLYQILKKYFSSRACYVPIIELFHDITLKTALGQSFDGLWLQKSSSLEERKRKLDVFTMNNFSNIAKYKTGYYTFQLPISSAMYLANIFDEELHRQAKSVLLEIGEYYQVQNDFADCYGDPAETGKIGTDIEEGKCTWLAVVALQRANPAQRKIMEEHYGRTEDQPVKAIRELYDELSIPEAFAAYKEESFNSIKTHIQQISKVLPPEVFFRLIRKMYKWDC